MPKYDVRFDDGRVVTVDAPLGANDYDISVMALDMLRAEMPAPAPEPPPERQDVFAPATMPAPRAESTEEEESALLEAAKGVAQFGIGIPRGVVGLGEGVGIGLAALLPEEQELALRDYIQRQAESAREAITPEFYDPEDISSKVGEVLGGTIPFFPAGAAGMAAGRALAARVGASRLAGTAAGGAAGAATLGSPANTGEALERARAAGVPEDEMTGIAAAGAVTGLFEGALPLAMGRLSRLATDPKIKAALEKLSPEEIDSVRENLGAFAANAAKAFGIEGSQEFVTAAMQNAIAQSYDPEQDIIDMGALEEATLGGTAGAIISAVADIALPGRGRGRPAPYDPKDFQDTVTRSSLFDPESGNTAMITPDIAEQLSALNIEPELGRSLTFEEVYALEKAGQVSEPLRELPDEELSAEEEEALANTLETGVDEAPAGDEVETEAAPAVEAETETETEVESTPELTERQAYVAKVEAAVEDLEAGDTIVNDMGDEFEVVAVNRNKNGKLLGIVVPKEGGGYGNIDLDGVGALLFPAPYIDSRTGERKLSEPGRIVKKEAEAKPTTEAVAPAVEAEVTAPVVEEPATTEALPAEPAEQVGEDILTAERFDELDVPKAAAIRKKFTGRSITDPEVQDGLRSYAGNSSARKTARDNVSALLATLEVAPSEPTATVSEPVGEPAGAVEGVEPVATGVSPADGGPELEVGRGRGVSDIGAGPEGVTAVAQAPDTGAVVGDGVPAAEPVVGEGVQPAALSTEADEAAFRNIQTKKREDLTTSEKTALTYAKAGMPLSSVIEIAAEDIVFQTTASSGNRGLGFFIWARQNGSPELNAALNTALAEAQDSLASSQSKAQRVATKNLVSTLQQPTLDMARINARVKDLRDRSNLTEAIQSPLPTPIADAVRGNNLAEAIRLLAEPGQVATQRTTTAGAETVVETSVPDTYRALAAPMKNYVGDVQVEVVEGLTDDAGAPIAGAYDAENNRILIDSERGMNPHTILHELQHPAIDKAIREDKLPAVKRLRKIFDELKPRLDGFYAGESLGEFIAELRSNPRLRTEVASITPKGRVSFFRRIMNELNNIVRAIIGKPPRSAADINTPLDNMILSIMEPPGSNAETFNAVFTSDKAEQDAYMDRYVAEYFAGGKKLSPDEGNRLTESFGRIFNRGTKKSTISNALSFASSLQLSDVFSYFSPRLGQLGRDLHNEFDLQNGSMRNIMSAVDRKYNRLNDWREKNKKKVQPFDRVVTMSTIGQVDPTKKRKAYEKDANKLFVYDRMKPLWDRLGPDGQEQWKLLRKHYQDMFADLKDVLFSNIDRYVEDADTAKNLKKQVFQEMFGKAELEVYFPLARQGDYWLTYNMNGERVVEAFNTQAERRAAYLEIEEAGGSQITPHGAPSASMIANGAPSGSFVDKTLNILREGNVNKDIQDQIIELFINALPETSLIRSMQTRKNRLGALEDSLQAFKQKGYSLARETLRIKHGNELRSIQNQIIGEIDTRMKLLPAAQARYVEASRAAERDPTRQNLARQREARKDLEEKLRRYGRDMGNPMAEALKDEVRLRINFALSPPNGAFMKLATIANRLTFVSFMGLNPASAFVQSGQIPLVSYWATAARTDNKTASKAYATATSMFGSSGFRRQNPVYDSAGNQVGTETVTGTNPSIDNYYIADEKGQLRIRPDLPMSDKKGFFEYTMPDGSTQKLSQREFLKLMLPLVQLASNRGQLGHSAIFEQLEVNSVWKNSRNVMDIITGITGLMFHNSEMFNRQVTLTANYLNELHRLNTNPTAEERGLSPQEKEAQAANEAIYLTQQTNGGSALITAPRMAQGTGALGPLGRTMMMFKTYGLGMWYHQLKSLRQALNSVEDPQLREAARKQLVGMTVATVSLLGLQGLTLTGGVLAILDMFDLLGDGEDELPAELQVEDYFKDKPMVWTGLINYATRMMGGELDISQRMGFRDLIIANSRYADKDADFYSQVGAALLGPSGSLFSNYVKSYNAFENGDARRGFELAAPAAFANISRSMRYADEGDLTRLGSPIIDEYTDMEIFGKALGFSSARRSRKQSRLGEKKGAEQRLTALASSLRQKRNIAMNAGDNEGVFKAQAEINEFNDKYSGKYPELFIGPESADKSLKQFWDGKRREVGGILFMTESFRNAAQDIADQESLKRQQTSK